MHLLADLIAAGSCAWADDRRDVAIATELTQRATGRQSAASATTPTPVSKVA
jgi:hypothetical protein